jgi:hypothetical protein
MAHKTGAEAPWLVEYSRLATVHWLDSDCFQVSDVRNFRYRGVGDPLPAWDDRDFRLSEVTKTDLVLSYWGGNAIAHVFLSFGFSNGEWLAVSIETRRRQNQPWSAFGGFLRNYPVIYVLADERDLIGVRSDVRRERVWIYGLTLTQEQRQRLLRDYLLRIQQVNAHPEWYNTLFNNCTTNILHHGRAVSPAVKYDWRILLSGYADRYCYRMGLLDTRLPFETLRQRSRLIRPEDACIDDDFSQDIRRQRASSFLPEIKE